MSSVQPIRLGLIGAGIFAREAHIPAFNALEDAFEIAAICSRTRASVDTARKLVNGHVDLYTDPRSILERDDIEAVDILMPIDTMPDMVTMVLQAGKHVISEKPLAPDVATGRKLLAAHTDQVWMVAENFRYEEALLEAANVIQGGEIGKPVAFHWDFYIAMTPSNQYYHTDWRRSGTFPGGFLMDGGVHVAAGLRLVLGEIRRVNATIIQVRSDLSPADTMSANLLFDSGVLGAWNMTYAHGAPWPHTLHVACERGAVRVDLESIEVVIGHETRRRSITSKSIEREFAAFATAVREGKPHRNTPEQALQDVAIMEALLQSSATQCSFAPERIVT